jgi:2-polyprenyl-3-methyl-5-hydroxy-6-metoxy-1,4-benzoquinol methylase
VVRLIRAVDPASVLDLGCGEGYVLEALVDAGVGAKLTGIDHSAQAVADARQRLGDRAEIQQGDVARDRPAESRFDTVMMLEVLEHLADPGAALEELAQLTSGHVIVSVPREPLFRALNLLRFKNLHRWGSDPEHLQHWTKRAFERQVDPIFTIVGRGHAFPWTLLLLQPRTR